MTEDEAQDRERTDDEAETVGPDDPLRQLFSGKRAWPRRDVARPVVAQGLTTTYHGRIVNVSRTGVLFVVLDPEFYAEPGDGIERILAAFPDGLEVRFPEDGMMVLATVVRVTPHGDDRLAIGCHFLRPLSSSEALLLGLRAAEIDVPEALEEELAISAFDGPPLSLALEPADGPPGGAPAFSGRVDGIGERTVDATAVTLTAPDQVARALGDAALQATFRAGRRRVAQALGQLVVCQRTPDGERTRVRVVLDEPVPDPVLDGAAGTA